MSSLLRRAGLGTRQLLKSYLTKVDLTTSTALPAIDVSAIDELSPQVGRKCLWRMLSGVVLVEVTGHRVCAFLPTRVRFRR
jgi:hypothetical protein